MPLSAGWQIYLATWKLIRGQFLIAMFFALSIIFIGFALGLLPFVGSLISGVVTMMLSAGVLISAQKMLNNKTSELEDLFVVFFDQDLLSKVWPLALIYGFASFLTTSFDPSVLGSFGRVADDVLNIVVIVIGVVIQIISTFALGLVTFDDRPVLESLEMSLMAFFRNWLVMVVAVGVITLGCLASVLTLGLGLLVLFPILYFSAYFFYLGMFHNFDFDAHLNPETTQTLISSQPQDRV